MAGRGLVALLAPAALFVALLLATALPRMRAAEAAGGTFAAPPVFGASGQAAVVFVGGSVDDLEGAARASGASGVWAQDASGTFQLLVVGGPAFLRETFVARFPAGFASATALTLTRPAGATSGPTLTPAPTATPASPTAPAVPARPPGTVPGPSAND